MKTSIKLAAPRKVVQEALQVTWLLKGHLKNAQLAYSRVGMLLARVRDEKLYAAIRHPDLYCGCGCNQDWLRGPCLEEYRKLRDHRGGK